MARHGWGAAIPSQRFLQRILAVLEPRQPALLAEFVDRQRNLAPIAAAHRSHDLHEIFRTVRQRLADGFARARSVQYWRPRPPSLDAGGRLRCGGCVEADLGDAA